MRYGFTRFLPGLPFRALLAVVYQGAPRTRTMQRTGYDLLPCGWHRDIEARIEAEPLIALMVAERFAGVPAACAAQLGERLMHCSFDDPAIAAGLAGSVSVR